MPSFSRIFSRKPTIFVQIASYRDAECQWTVRDLFLKAAHPERVFVGICWQFDAEADAHCFTEPAPFPKQVRISKFHPSESEGVCWARYEAQKLYKGEDYVLMIDSHMRFIQNWDEVMIDELAACDSPKPVLSCYPPGYTPPDKLDPFAKPGIQCLNHPDESGDIRGRGEPLDHFPKRPLRGAFLAAGLIFAKGELVKEVPYDPYLYFNQEELSLAARFYTHGWDVYHPARILLYHYYKSPGDPDNTRPLHWEDNRDWHLLQQRARKRFRHLLGNEISTDAEVTKKLSQYGMGKARSLKEFEEFAGLDFTKWEVLPKGLTGSFVPQANEYRSKPILAPQKKRTQTPLQHAPLAPGHFLPPFVLPESRGSLLEIQLYAGRHLLLFFLPLDFPAYLDEFLTQKEKLEKIDAHKVLVVNGTKEEAAATTEKYNIPFPVLADESAALCEAFGKQDARMKPFTVWLNANQKIMRVIEERNALNHLGEIMRLPLATGNVIHAQLVSRPHAPVIIIPDAITETLATELLTYWQKGEKYNGTIGVGGNEDIHLEGKRRVDVNIDDAALLARIDAHLARSLLPEIRKAGHVDIRYRERYKIGRYGSDDAGYYHQHRDTGAPELAYRLYSLSLVLNDSFEGGHLVFPEYDNIHYQPPRLSALVFPSPLLHRVTPVTKGERFVMVSFLFGEAQGAYRKQQQEAEGKAYTPTDVRMNGTEPFPRLEESAYYRSVLGD